MVNAFVVKTRKNGQPGTLKNIVQVDVFVKDDNEGSLKVTEVISLTYLVCDVLDMSNYFRLLSTLCFPIKMLCDNHCFLLFTRNTKSVILDCK